MQSSSKPGNPTQPGSAARRKPTDAEIAAAAYHLHIENGSMHGRDLDDWLKAEQLLTQHMKASAIERNSHSSPVTVQPPSTGEMPSGHTAPKVTREEIRRQMTAFRPASRQTRPSKHAVRANS